MARQIWKDPSSIEPQGFDYTNWLSKLGSGITISGSTWVVEDIDDDAAPLTLSDDAIVVGGLKTHVTLTAGYCPSGPPGTVGNRYYVTNHITTSTGVEDERSFTVRMRQG